MAHASKKTTIFILIAIFVVAICFSFLALPKNVYAFTGNYDSYYIYQEEGTDTGITEDYSDSGPYSGSYDYTIDSLHYYIDYTESYVMEGFAADQSYSYYAEVYEEGYVENAEEEDLGYYEFSESGHDTLTYTMDDTEYTQDYDWSIEGWEEITRQPVRVNDMTCYQINITEDNEFELVFWHEYENNNWITIYDKDGNLVYRKDFPYGKPTVIIDLPDGTYTVKTFHEEGKILQEFVIGKP